MRTVNIHEAKTHLSRLLEDVVKSGPITIAKAGKPIATLNPIKEPEKTGKRKLGFLDGQFKVPDDFNEMFQKEIEEMFYGDGG